MRGKPEKEGPNWSWMMRDLQMKDIPWKNSMAQVINFKHPQYSWRALFSI